jgi:hypothetical protein
MAITMIVDLEQQIRRPNPLKKEKNTLVTFERFEVNRVS